MRQTSLRHRSQLQWTARAEEPGFGKEEPGEDSLYPKDYMGDHKAMMLADAHEVAVKIRSSETGKMKFSFHIPFG
jgi:hypothetical protein